MKPSMKKSGHAKAKRTNGSCLVFILVELEVKPGLMMKAISQFKLILNESNFNCAGGFCLLFINRDLLSAVMGVPPLIEAGSRVPLIRLRH